MLKMLFLENKYSNIYNKIRRFMVFGGYEIKFEGLWEYVRENLRMITIIIIL